MVAGDIQIAAPEWHGRELSWQKSAGATMQVLATTSDTTPDFRTGPSRVIYAYSIATADSTSIEGLSTDSKRFVGSRVAGPPAPAQINLVMNWIEELKQRIK